jgi:hypothetical protein
MDTFTVGKMVVAILERGHIPISNEEAIDAAVDDNIEGELFDE